MISIVVPTCNRPQMLTACLDKFSHEVQRLDSSVYEVIITDDSSDDATQKLIATQYPDIKYFKGPRKGPAFNRNSGAANATGEWVMFIDDDCIPSDDLVKEYLKAIADNPGVQVFEGCIKADREKKHHLEESPINVTGGYMWSCNIMLSRLFFNELGGFDEGFPFAAMEDVDLRVRVNKSGKKIIFAKDAMVIHPWRLQDKLLEMTAKRAKSEDYFYKKHPELLSNKYSLRGELRFYWKFFKSILQYGLAGSVDIVRAHNLDKKIFNNRLKEANK
ncbi:MAG: glycosyltransferase family 2 protein [Bacteroidia bacterium]